MIGRDQIAMRPTGGKWTTPSPDRRRGWRERAARRQDASFLAESHERRCCAPVHACD